MEIQDSNHHDIGYGKLLANLLHFGRLLRQAGIPVSANQVSGLAEGLVHIDISSREDFYHAARGFFLHDISRLQQFDIAFNLFWSQYFQILVDLPGTNKQDHLSKLLEDDHASIKVRSRKIDTKIKIPRENHNPVAPEFDVQSTFSPDEILRRKDFHEYSDDEFQRAKLIIQELTWSFEQRRSRRKIRTRNQTKLIDRRRSMRNYLGIENEIIDFEWRKFKYKSRPIILLCDISGSMERYSKIFLHFLYAMVQDTRSIETFVFGTRLTRLTKHLQHADIDHMLESLSLNIIDWSGGTRIGESLKTFNYVWSRRLPSQKAVVMVISDGWDRGDDKVLEREISRLSRLTHRLIWLNPLAGSAEYQPLVSGIKIVLPYIDDFLPLASLDNLEALVNKLDSLG